MLENKHNHYSITLRGIWRKTRKKETPEMKRNFLTINK